MSAALQDATVIRGGGPILDGVSVTCLPSHFTAFCGPNGAGKTTAFSLLTGALRPDRGTSWFDGQEVRGIPVAALARRRAVVSQSSLLSFPFHVHEVVAMGRAPHEGRTTPQRDATVVAEVMAAMDIMGFADRNYLTLSGGERQRVNIARALAQVWEPVDDIGERWLFLDEPTSALDLKHQILLMRLLRRLASDGWGILAVLHDLQLVQEHAQTVGLFKAGRLVACDATAEVLTPESVQSTFGLDEPYAALA